jgi:hypothetical protein
MENIIIQVNKPCKTNREELDLILEVLNSKGSYKRVGARFTNLRTDTKYRVTEAHYSEGILTKAILVRDNS